MTRREKVKTKSRPVVEVNEEKVEAEGVWKEVQGVLSEEDEDFHVKEPGTPKNIKTGSYGKYEMV